MSVYARSIVWVDAYGARTIIKVQSQTGAASAEASLEALSNASVVEFWESVITPGAPAPVALTYQSVVNRAVFAFACADGTLYNVIVPAPSASIFMADGVTVNPADANVVAFVAAAIAAPLCNNAGSPVTAFVNGQLLPYAKQPL